MVVGQGAVGPCFLLHIQDLWMHTNSYTDHYTTPEIWRTHPDLVSQIWWTLQWQVQINRTQTANNMACSPLFPWTFHHISLVPTFKLPSTHKVSIHLEVLQVSSSSQVQDTSMAFLSMVISMVRIWPVVLHHRLLKHHCLELVVGMVQDVRAQLHR